MKKIFTLALISYFTFPIFNNFKPVNAQSSCQGTINSVVNDIKSKGVRTVLIEESNVSEYYTNNPTNRNTSLVLTLSSWDKNETNMDRSSEGIIANILNSSVLMKTYADRIVANCNNYADITLVKNGTDWSAEYALQPNGKTKLRTCVSPGPGNVRLSWNQTPCP